METKFGEWGLLWPLARDSLNNLYEAPASADSIVTSKEFT